MIEAMRAQGVTRLLSLSTFSYTLPDENVCPPCPPRSLHRRRVWYSSADIIPYTTCAESGRGSNGSSNCSCASLFRNRAQRSES